MSAESDTLRRRYPEFASVADWPDATIDEFIADAGSEPDVDVWGATQWLKGVLALAAHLMAVAKRSSNASASGGPGAAVGAITSIKTGQESVSYEATIRMGDASDLDASLRSTPYGLEYIRLREQVSGHPLITF